MKDKEIKKKIESILNRHFKETGKIIYSVTTIRVLNNKFNYNLEIKFKQDFISNGWKNENPKLL